METNGELHLMRRILPQCQTVFDIGANVGAWTKLALQVNPHLSVHCFEPNRVAFQRLSVELASQGVVCVNCGLSAHPGDAWLYVFGEANEMNSLYQRQGLENSGLSAQMMQERVRLETIERYCKDQHISMVDFCKVDVEGHELEVFRGMTSLLAQQCIKVIQFEYGGCNIDSGVLLKDIFHFFKPFDYAFFKVMPEGLRPVPHYDQCLENLQYQNWVIMAHSCSLLL